MTLSDKMKEYEGVEFENKEEEVEEINFKIGMTTDQIEELKKRIPCELPELYEELFRFTTGFEGVLDEIEFTGIEEEKPVLENIFSNQIIIAKDGEKNYWIVDLNKSSKVWGPIFFISYNPEVVVYQADDLQDFIQETIKFGIPPWIGNIKKVYKESSNNIWKNNPNTLTYKECQESEDPILIDFSNELGVNYIYIDIRKAKIGDGFSWGRYGEKTILKRFKTYRVFAYEKQGILKKFLSK